MTELAALNVKITGDSTDLKAAVNTATGDLARLGASAKAAGGQVAALGPKVGAVGGAVASASGNVRVFSQSLSQVAQQGAATGQWAQAFSIQAADIGMNFGLVGTAIGIAITVLGPLAAGMLSASEKTGAMAEAVKELTDATEAFKISADAIRFGVDQEEVVMIREANRLMAELARINEAWQNSDSLGARQRLAEEAREIKAALAPLNANIEAYRKARDEAEALQRQVDLVAEAARKATEATYGIGGALGSAIGKAQALAGAMWDVASAAAARVNAERSSGVYGQVGARGDPRQFEDGASNTFNRENFAVPSGGVGGGSSGGGGAGRDYAGELQAFQETLMTETELEAAQFAERQTLLQEFLSAKVVSLQEYQAYEQEIKAAHEAKMAEIEATAQQQRLSQTAGMFGALASIAQAGGQRMAKAAAAFQAIEGTVNAYGAAIKALNTPGLTPAGRFAAYASVLAAGLKGVASIRQAGGIGGGSGGAAGGVAQAAGPSQAPLDVRLTGINANDLFSGAQLGSLLDRLSATAGDRGYRLMVAA